MNAQNEIVRTGEFEDAEEELGKDGVQPGATGGVGMEWVPEEDDYEDDEYKFEEDQVAVDEHGDVQMTRQYRQ